MKPRDLVAFICAALVVAGVAVIYPPAGLITAGLAMAVIFLVDLEPRRRA